MRPPAQRSICAFVCPSKGPIFDADSVEFLRQARLGVSSRQGMSVMANAYPVSGNRKQYSSSSSVRRPSSRRRPTQLTATASDVRAEAVAASVAATSAYAPESVGGEHPGEPVPIAGPSAGEPRG